MPRKGFTLLELLVVVAVVAILVAILLPALSRARRQARSTACLSQLRQIAAGVHLYAYDNNDQFPRSSHSALAHTVMPWGYALMPYLGRGTYTGPGSNWDGLFNGLYRCPEDIRRDRWSYGKNVWFELGPAETGEVEGTASAATYERMQRVLRPSATVLFGELGSGAMADHIMAHFWYLGGAPEVDSRRHGVTSNYVFVDGHGESRVFATTFVLSPNLDLWHPGRAY